MALSAADVAEALSWADPALQPWFEAWGVPFTPLEGVALALSLWMVALNLRVHPFAWPLAMASSVLYGVLFARYQLYGEAVLQLVFVAVSVWGWSQWWRRRASSAQELAGVAPEGVLVVRHLSRRGLAWVLLAWLCLWPLLAAVLERWTDSDVPYWDALPTAGSLIGQWLLARKYIQNWPVWLLVNVVSVGLFAHKDLWLTAALYSVFALLSLVGWRAWRRLEGREHA